MTRYLYEKDLRPMKYTILTSTKHDRTVSEIARRLGMTDAKLRRVLIRKLDMSFLENLESRWQMGRNTQTTAIRLQRSSGANSSPDSYPSWIQRRCRRYTVTLQQ